VPGCRGRWPHLQRRPSIGLVTNETGDRATVEIDASSLQIRFTPTRHYLVTLSQFERIFGSPANNALPDSSAIRLGGLAGPIPIGACSKSGAAVAIGLKVGMRGLPRHWPVRREGGVPRKILPSTQTAEFQLTPFSGGLGTGPHGGRPNWRRHVSRSHKYNRVERKRAQRVDHDQWRPHQSIS
jgi:hypothetical protein